MAQRYKAKPHEDIMQIARAFGFRNWQTVYNHPENETLRALRPDPHVLYEGDEVYIPDVEPKELECGTGTKHTFTLPQPQTLLQIVLDDDYEEPYPDVKYEVWINDALHCEGRTRSDGLIHEMVPVGHKCEVKVWFDKETEDDPETCETIQVFIGHLNPIGTIEGVQDRLTNLGYNCGEDERGEVGDFTREALRAFQYDMGLIPIGDIDLATRDALVEAHGS